MSTKNLVQLRSLLEQYIKSSRVPGSVLSSTALIDGFRSAHGGEIEEVSKQLENIALLKFLNDIGARKHHVLWSPQQIELFASYIGIPQTITVETTQNGKRVFVKKIVPESTIEELENYLGRLTISPKSRRARHSPLTLLYNDVSKKAKSMQDKVSDVMKALKAEASKKRA